MSFPARVALLGASLVACGRGGRQTTIAPGPTLPSASSRVDSFQIAMPELGGRRRTVRVYLPPGYGGGDGGGVSFPVLYLQDAQQLFAPGPFGDWRVDETIDSLVAGGRLRGVIVVGVDHGGARRWDEYGPWTNRQMRDWIDSSWTKPTEGGEGAAYVSFLANTLKPEIDRRYHTLPDRASTGVGGSSMGGLVALYAGLARPDVFSRVMAMSSAVWFAEDGGPWLSRNRMVSYARERAPRLPPNVRFYVDVGTSERSRDADPSGVVDGAGRPVTYPRAYAEGSEAVVGALRAGGVPASSVRLVVDSGAVHHETAWSRRLPGALTWLYQ